MRHFLPLLVAILVALPALAQSPVGDWSGGLDVSTIQPDGPTLSIIVHITETDGEYAATMDSPDQGAFGIPFDTASMEGDLLTLTAATLGVTYTGTVSDGQIDGTWSQGPAEIPLMLAPHVAAEEVAEAPSGAKADIKPGDFTGDWAGIMEVAGGGQIRVTFHLTKLEDGTYDVSVSAPAQGADHFELGKATISGNAVTIPVPPASAEFVGTFSDDEMTAEGQWQQGGEKIDMTLTRQ